MTYAINTPNHFGCNMTKDEIQWPVFTQSEPPEYCGQIYRICAWMVPNGTHKRLGLTNNQLSLFKTPGGQYAEDLSTAEKLARLEYNALPAMAGAA
jgi:hypothetical protein